MAMSSEKLPPGVLAEVRLRKSTLTPGQPIKLLGVEFAPLSLPWERRMQTFSVVAFIFLFLLFSVFVAGCMVYLIFYTSFWWLALLYAGWIYYDQDIGENGGRQPWSCFVRRWSLWKYFARYFPVTLVKTAELDPTKNYLFCYHPHGILCFGAFSCFATDALNVRELFGGIFTRLLVLNQNFKYPGVRELASWSGINAATKRGMENVLSGPPGTAAVLIPGGAREALNKKDDEIQLVLNRRKGFAKLALRFGTDLVPVFSFGENFLYDQYPNPEGSRLRRFQSWFESRFAFVPPAFYGRGIFQYTWGLLPYRIPINVVVGTPIPVTKVDEPTQEQVEELHKKYVEALKELYENYRPYYGRDGVKLVVT